MVSTGADSFIISESSFLPISAIVLIHLQYRALCINGAAAKSFASFQRHVREALVRAYGIGEQEEEWLAEMIIPDQGALESLQERMVGKLFGSEITSRDVALQQLLSHIILVLMDSGYSSTKEKATIAYDSRLRCLLKDIACSFNHSKKSISFLVSLVESDYLFQMASNQGKGDASINCEVAPSNSYTKGVVIGLSAVAGGLLVGVTGGLAVPLIAGGLSTVGLAGAGLAGFGSVAGAAIFGSTLGLAGASIAGFKINRHFNLDEFFFTGLTSNNNVSMTNTIAISGWINTLDASVEQWQWLTEVNPLVDINVLQFERQLLVDLTTAAEEFLKANLIGYGIYGAAVAATGTLAMAISLPLTALQGVAMIDNPWNLCLSKCETAGIVLARNVLARRLGGRKPVQLIGHGMGARVIVFCLLELVKLGNEEGLDIYGLIDSIYLFGAAISLSIPEWESISSVPASRFVNCFSENDWFLKVLFRLQLSPVAGTEKIDVQKIQDVDCSSLIGSHGDYIEKIQELAVAVGYERVI